MGVAWDHRPIRTKKTVRVRPFFTPKFGGLAAAPNRARLARPGVSMSFDAAAALIIDGKKTSPAVARPASGEKVLLCPLQSIYQTFFTCSTRPHQYDLKMNFMSFHLGCFLACCFFHLGHLYSLADAMPNRRPSTLCSDKANVCTRL